MAETTETFDSGPARDPVAVGAGAGAAAAPCEVPPRSRVELTAAGRSGAVRREARPGGLRRFIGFIGWVFSGFGLAHAFRRRGPSFADQEITVYAVHRAFFLWPLVLFGFIAAPIVSHWQAKTGVFMGWFYIWVLTYTLVSLLFDISTWSFLLWAGIFLFIYVLSRYVEVVRNVQILKHLWGYLHGLQPTLSRGFALMMSWLLLIPWIGSLFNTFTNGRKRFTPNEIGEFHLGEGSELTDRTGMQFRTRYRDLFETLLGFGAGDLQAVDGTGVVRKRWENILFLAFIWPRMDKILHQRAAVVDNPSNEPVEVEQVRRGGGR